MRRVTVGVALLVAGLAVVVWLNRDVTGATAAEPSKASNGEKPDTDRKKLRAPRPWLDELDAGISFEGVTEAPHFDLANLDFEALRARTPDSLYWLMAMPTDDPELLEQRREAKRRRNEQYGRVLSSTASVEEIHDYFAYRRKLSEDYIEVVQLILDEHGDDLSDRDTGLFEFTIAMHTARLAELPTKLDDALRRKSEYDEVKKAWQAQQRAEADRSGSDTENSPSSDQ